MSKQEKVAGDDVGAIRDRTLTYHARTRLAQDNGVNICQQRRQNAGWRKITTEIDSSDAAGIPGAGVAAMCDSTATVFDDGFSEVKAGPHTNLRATWR